MSIFILFILIAIAFHEFGHFATAKTFGIRVYKFFIGFGPKLWSVHKGGTEYGVSAFPVGGYVKIAGMNPLEEIPDEDKEGTFKSKPAWQRAIVLASGSFTHFIAAFIIIAAIIAISGVAEGVTTTLDAVGSESGAATPADRAGIKPGDKLLSIGGVPIKSWPDAQRAIKARPGQNVAIVVARGTRTLTLQATLGTCAQVEGEPVSCAAGAPGKSVGFLGVSPKPKIVHKSIPAVIGMTGKQIGVGMKESLFAFGKIFRPSTLGRLFKVAAGSEQRRPDDPATVVGFGRATGGLAKNRDFAQLFLWIASFNIFVGVANLLPLPPLDGGHLAVLGYEKLRRREVDMRKLVPITAAVLTAFGMLFFLLLYLDIVKPLPQFPG